MMARTHALSGAAAWLAAAPPAAVATGAPLEPTTLLAGAVITAGAALIPDLDMPRSTIARALGPATVLLSVLVARLAGGHRAATHSLAFTLLLPVAVWAGMHTPAGGLVTIAVAAVCVGLALRAVGPREINTGGLIDLGLLAWTAGLTWWALTVVDADWLPAALGLGVALHLLGDLATPHGIPLLWPNPTRYAVPLLADGTGGRIETIVSGVLLMLLAALTLAHLGAGR